MVIMIVSSSYCYPDLNVAVKASKTSQHMTGKDADIDIGERQHDKLLFKYIKKNLHFDQLIDDPNFVWVHVSFPGMTRTKIKY